MHTVETASTGDYWTQIDRSAFEETGLDVLLIRNYNTGWSGGDRNNGHIRRIDVRLWDIPILGESYFGDLENYGQPTRIYGLSMENYMKDRPYMDDVEFADNISSMLDALKDVEDNNDNGTIDKREDANRNGRLDGDKIHTDMATWVDPEKLNPFNIDNDLYVELPQQDGDPALLDAGQQISGEYDKAAVLQHVITHELGHAVGMGAGDPSFVDSVGHCYDPACVMYEYSINWDRGATFCPYHQSMIQIHNQ
jgi:hypothetical protein